MAPYMEQTTVTGKLLFTLTVAKVYTYLRQEADYMTGKAKSAPRCLGLFSSTPQKPGAGRKSCY